MHMESCFFFLSTTGLIENKVAAMYNISVIFMPHFEKAGDF